MASLSYRDLMRDRSDAVGFNKSTLLGILLASSVLGSSGAFAAQSGPSPDAASGNATSNAGVDVADIVVTARKRAESIQDTPLSIAAISSSQVQDRRILEFRDLPRIVPGVSVALSSGQNQTYIRGIGLRSTSLGADSSVALHVDGVPVGRPFAQLSSFFDVDRIEVLKGPQGTLYGRNATGGNINVISKKPTASLDGYVTGTYGNYNHLQIDAAVGGPLNESGTVQARIAMQSINHDGYGRNVARNEDIDDENRKALRASLYLKPTEKSSILLTAEYAGENDHNYAIHYFGPYSSATQVRGIALGGIGVPYSNDIAGDQTVRNKRSARALTLTADAELADELTLRSVTGYRRYTRDNFFDPDNTSYPVALFRSRERSKQFSEELQLLYNSSKLNAIVGAFYYHEKIFGDLYAPLVQAAIDFNIPGALFGQTGTEPIDAYAVFTEATYEILPKLRLTAGLRYSYEKRSAEGTFFSINPAARSNIALPTNFKANWSALTPKFGIDFSPAEDVMLYASATRGFKSGAINIGSTNPPVNPENIWAYEAGIKSSLLDRRLMLNAAAFYYDFTNMQMNQVTGATTLTVNIKGATIKGVDLSFNAKLSDYLSIHGDASYLDAKFADFRTQNPARPALGILDLKGNTLPQAPKWTVNGGAEFSLPIHGDGKLSVRGDANWRSLAYFSEFNERNVAAKGYALIDAAVRYETANKKWLFTLYGKNLANKLAPATMTVSSPLYGIPLNGSNIAPRTYGITASYKFF